MMKNDKNTARWAGFFYLLNVIFSVLYMEYIPSQIMVSGDAEGTLTKLLSNETLFRIGILVGIAGHLSFILLPLTLYKLLNQVNKRIAILMVALALISVPVSFSFILDQINFLDLLKDYDLGLITRDNLATSARSLYRSLMNGFFLNQVYWGLWLFPFGLLAFKSGFLPRFLGISLMLGCITYMVDIGGAILIKDYYDHVSTDLLIIPAAIGEIGMCLWLLIFGTKQNIRF
ncbi:DUF4386 domain-containing protein [Roseivirga sp.]|uniref:DUF4386 domain-containing protein n=1 Tax=Roseivirga sp. TaxID=1964215 RepID=UPI003B521A83